MSDEERRELLTDDVTSSCNSLPENQQPDGSYGTIDSCKTRRLVDPTWRHYMIVPVAFLFVSMYLMSYTVLIQYTFFYFVKNETVVDISQISKCAANTSTPAFKEYENAQATASKWNIYFALAAGIPSIFSNIIIGSYTDRVGRKFLMLLCSAGVFLRIAIVSIVIYTEADLSYVIIGVVLEGCMGYFTNFLQTASAYIADITYPGESRSVGIACLALSFGLSLTVMSPVTGVLIQTCGFFITILIAVILLVMSLLCILCILPETLTKDLRSPETSLKIHISNVFKFYIAGEYKREYILAITAFVFICVSVFGKQGVETLYQLNKPFCWTPLHIGVYSGAKGFIQDVLGVLLIKVFRSRCTDAFLGMVGAISAGGYSLLLGLAQSDVVLYIAAAVGIGSALPMVLTKAIVSSRTASDKQGAIFCSFSAIETVCQVTSAVIGNGIYSATVNFFSGLVFLLIAVLCLISGALLLVIYLTSRTKSSRVLTEIAVPTESSQGDDI